MTDSQSIISNSHPLDGALLAKSSEFKGLPRYERKKAQTRERIYRAALKLFAERGLSATTVDEIVAVAHVAKGTFFNYFGSKEQIFGLFVEIQLGKLAEAAEEARKTERSIRDVLHRAFQGLGMEVSSSPLLARALVAAILGNDAARETVAAGMADGRRLLAEILRLGQKRGHVTSYRSTRAMSLAFQEALFGALVLWAIRPQASLSAFLDASFTNYWTCIAAQKGRSR